MHIEDHINELRAELAAAYDPAERAEIQAELDVAQAELQQVIANQVSGPPS